MKSKLQIKNQNGYTMLEVLVAMTLGLVVLGSAIGMQVSHRKGYKITQSKLSMQTNARFAFEFISSSLRELGSAGCRTVEAYYGDDPDDQNERNYKIAFIDEKIAFADFRLGKELLGYENTEGSTLWVPAVSGDFSFTGDMLDGSDALTVRGAIGQSYPVDMNLAAGEYTPSQIQLNLANISNVQLKPNNYAVLSQCNAAEVFKITGTDAQVAAGTIYHGAGILGDDNASAAFTQENYAITSVAELRRVAVSTYYVADNSNGIPTLYRDVDNIAYPLVEGVERMQIEYGVKTNATTVNIPNEFHDAAWVEANDMWLKVASVRLGFIMRSKDQVFEKDVTKTYNLPGTTVYSYTPTDRYARLIYTATVNLRNRTLGKRT